MVELVLVGSDLLPNAEAEIASVRRMQTRILDLGAVGMPLSIAIVHHCSIGDQQKAPHADDTRLAGPAPIIASREESSLRPWSIDGGQEVAGTGD
jgi:N-acyl-D-aspartate/D-glutamate deacylase